MKSLRDRFALTFVLLLGVQSVALAQSLPKYEIYELEHSGASIGISDTYAATVVDRAANTLWLCTLSFHQSPIGPKLYVDKNECHVSPKGPFPNLANMKAAQKTTPDLSRRFSNMFLWLVDQETGDVSLCFEDITLTYNNNEVGCVPLTHPKP